MSVNNRFYFSLLLLIGLGLAVFAAPTLAQVSVEPTDPRSYGMTSGRLVATLAAVVALIGIVIGGLALARPAGRFGAAFWRFGAIAAGLIGAVVGGLRVATAGGLGTGGGGVLGRSLRWHSG